MTVDQIHEETRRLPREQVAELVDWLNLDLHPADDDSVGAEWKQETRRRLDQIAKGAVQGIPGEGVSSKVRAIVGR